MAKTSRPPAQAIVASAGAYSTFGGDNNVFSQEAAIASGQGVDLGNGMVGINLPAPVTRNGVPARSGMGAEAQALMADDIVVAGQFGYKNTPGTFYDPKNTKQVRKKYKGEDPERPAQILEAPTWTSNPVRPRTIAAGYDPEDKKLTVVFRDGTVYNYYDVPPAIWNRFHTMHSKGLFIRNVLDGYDRGQARLSLIEDIDLQQEFYVNRVNQQVSGGLGNWKPKRIAKVPKSSHGKNSPRSSTKGRQSPRTK
jgi:hypothetical protein